MPSSPTATPTPLRTATPTPAATSTAFSQAAFTCPTSDAATSVAQGGVSSIDGQSRKSSGLRVTRSGYVTPGRLAVTYSTSTVSGREALYTAHEQAAGGSLVQSFAFSAIGKTVHVLSVPAAQMNAIAATLRTQSGVESVAVTGAHRYTTSVTTPYYPSDPYFQGFAVTVAPTPAATLPPATYETPPYVENGSVPGQWDMHAIQLERAFAYSQPANGSSFTNIAGALGSSSIKIAIIDTGEDPHHPELAHIAYQRCFITNPSGTQSSSTFETDPLGHGTDVAGIAAADTGNAFGFSAAGGNSSIYAYRVFPTPDDNCANENSTDQQCGADTSDIAAAIDDAVTQKVNIISMSLGGDTCGTGTGFAADGDSDPVEGAAVANAIAANVIVVAASGNSGGSGVAAPACDTGVIAAGASALDDGVANATGHTGGSAASPVEYVASYTQYGATNTPTSASSWGIVAPGGDPLNDNDADNLHWIENIWTSTPYQLNSSDTNFTGECTDDYPNSSGVTSPVDCRTLIAGTSMATPHVAGVAALVLAVSGTKYATATAMKTLLCQTADNIGGNQGCGRLNAYRAVATALGDTP